MQQRERANDCNIFLVSLEGRAEVNFWYLVVKMSLYAHIYKIIIENSVFTEKITGKMWRNIGKTSAGQQ